MAFTPKSKEFESKAGNKYTFQTVPNSTALKILDQGTNDSGKLLNTEMTKLMLENVVVDPQGLEVDDFESLLELEEVSGAAFVFFRTGR